MTKLMQLIDPDHREDLEVDGLRFEIRAANGIVKSDIYRCMEKDDDGNWDASVSELLPSMVKIITKFHDYPDLTPAEVLDRLPSGLIVQKMFALIVRSTILSEDERKNSDSSSDSPSTDSTGTANNADGKTTDVSKTETVSPPRHRKGLKKR